MPQDVRIPDLPMASLIVAKRDTLVFCSDPTGTPAVQQVLVDDVLTLLRVSTASSATRLSPGDGYFYRWRPRTGGSGAIVGEWEKVSALALQCPDNNLFYALSVRLVDGFPDTQWDPLPLVCQNPDDALYYEWQPVLGNDGITVNGQWVLSTETTAGVAVMNIDDNVTYTWTPRTGSSGAIIGQWV